MNRVVLWRVADALVLLAFAFSIVVQLNDPDPFEWIAIYAAAGAACAMGLLNRGSWLFPAAVAAVATAWAATIAPSVVGRVPFADMFEAFEMKDLGIEQSREMYGLLIVALWTAVVAVRLRAGRAASPASSGRDPETGR